VEGKQFGVFCSRSPLGTNKSGQGTQTHTGARAEQCYWANRGANRNERHM
jgi:hypothetical protein